MAKRFTDTNKYKTLFYRGLPGPYKLLWDLINCECDHAGVWICDFETAQIYVGKDMPLDKARALELFNAGEVRVTELEGGQLWFLPGFIEMQYNGTTLNPKDRVQKSAIAILSRHGLLDDSLTLVIPNKPLTSPLEGAKYKYKDKDKDKDKDMGGAGGLTDEQLLELEAWTHAAAEQTDPQLEAMEMKEGRWPPGFDRRLAVLNHRDLAIRYSWKFSSQQQFRSSLLKVLRDDSKKSTNTKPISAGDRKSNHTAALIDAHRRKYSDDAP